MAASIQSKYTRGWMVLRSPPSSRSLPASVFGKSHGVLLVQVKVSGKLPQVRFALGRLVDLKKQVDGVLPVSICKKETETQRISFLMTLKRLRFCFLDTSDATSQPDCVSLWWKIKQKAENLQHVCETFDNCSL